MKKIYFVLTFLTTLFSSLLFAVTPVITGLTPNFGPVDGTSSVTIHGSGFTGATEVDFGTRPFLVGPGFTVLDDSTIVVPSTTPATFPGVVGVTVKVGVNASPANHPFSEFVYQGQWYTYVPDFNGGGPANVYAYTTGATTSPIVIPIQNGGNDVCILPNGSIAYAVNSGSGSLSIIDVATNSVLSNYPIPGANFPIAMAISPNGIQAYIVNYSINTVDELNLSTPTSPAFVRSISVGSGPECVAITTDGSKAYVTNTVSQNLTIIDTATGSPTPFPVPGAAKPSWMVMAPDGLTGYFSSIDSIWPLTNLTGTPVIQPLITGFQFSLSNFFPEIVITPDGSTIYATNTGSNTVSPVDLRPSPPVVGTPITVQLAPNGVSISPDAHYAYVSNGIDSTISVITATIPPTVTNAHPSGIVTPTDSATTPDQAPLAFFTANTALPHLQVAFDASSSNSPVGTIANYNWDFGDSTPIVNTATPTITHQYALPGTYPITLTVTNSAGTSTTRVFTGQIVNLNGGPSAATTLPVTTLLPLPPTATTEQKKEKYLTQTCYKNTITLHAAAGGNPPVLYRIYSNASLSNLLATVPASNPSVVLCSSHKHTVYYIVAVDALGNTSAVTVIEF